MAISDCIQEGPIFPKKVKGIVLDFGKNHYIQKGPIFPKKAKGIVLHFGKNHYIEEGPIFPNKALGFGKKLLHSKRAYFSQESVGYSLTFLENH